MQQQEYEAYVGELVEEHVRHSAQAGSSPFEPARAVKAARGSVEALLPQGLATAGMYLRVALLDADPFGRCWFGAGGRNAAGAAWLYHLVVEPALRGRGLGRALLRAVEEEALRCGARSLELNVFAWNEPARRLYAAAGYEPVNLHLRKPLPPAPAAGRSPLPPGA